ncbi:tetratricopeptide repeat protein [Hymenobacter sp. BT770]|uniref:tetratricopeptide repeat protein n=1 Tax=Hymenobacter sp. BT770 TaxID=2886942 RepID=UPI001D0FEBEB|nr:tetratricopeptide repeat protein [Hymenobacter sp. BT770]MCC3153551.1 tetratricopeptide repeat protein [Hymenobacter sp. BT770]MDO3415787.1 tetratricopeptide repeat protein [Hymenobacter sp. BT770]
MKAYIVLFFLGLAQPTLPAPASAQTARRQQRPQPSRLDTAGVRRLLALAQELRATDAAQATKLSYQALELARQLHDSRAEGEARLAISIGLRRQSQFEQARTYALQALRLFQSRADPRGQGKAWLQLSLIHMLQGNPAPALAAALKGLPLAEKAGDAQTVTRLEANLGDIYYSMGNYAEALAVLRVVLKRGERTGDKQVVLTALNGLGNSYEQLRKWPQALAYYQRALALSRELGDTSGEIGNETNLAQVHGMLGHQAEALAHGLRARQLVQATHDDYNLPLVELMLAQAYLLAQQPDSALALAHQSLTLSEQARSKDNIRKAADILARAYALRRNFEQAYRYRTLHMAYNDSLSGEDTQRRTSALRFGYELDRKQAQINLLTKTRELQAQTAARQRMQLYGLLAGLVGVVLVVALLLRNIFLKLRTNRRLQEKNVEIAAHRDTLDRTLTELKTTQAQLVQREKMASLGELTAGVAHEIQNPLNFVTNFSDLSVELAAELEMELAKEPLTVGGKHTIDQLLQELTQNQSKIHEHGHRADLIVKRMLEHSRSSNGEPQVTDLNALVEDSLRLAYHGWRAKEKNFTAVLISDLDPGMLPLRVVPQDLSRVLLNLLTNAFYAVAEKSRQIGESYRPEVCVQTRRTASAVQILVRDNGNGIPAGVQAKVFQPFFTTKPTGEGTGLGLSLSYDIVTKEHGGSMEVESEEGKYSQFRISLPVRVSEMVNSI